MTYKLHCYFGVESNSNTNQSESKGLIEFCLGLKAVAFEGSISN